MPRHDDARHLLERDRVAQRARERRDRVGLLELVDELGAQHAVREHRRCASVTTVSATVLPR